MKVDVLQPSESLKPFVKNYVFIDGEGGTLNRIVPDTCLVMAFRYKGDITVSQSGTESRLSPSTISGIRKTHRLIRYEKNTGNVIVTLKEAGAAAFLKSPLHELFEQSLSLDHFLNRQQLADVEEQLAEAVNHQQRLRIIESLLHSHLKTSHQDKLVAEAIKRISDSNGLLRIKDLIAALYISQDAFEKRFRKIVGTSPKQFSSIVRLRNLIKCKVNPETFTALAHEAGYFDQAHFNKEFKLFTGQTPSDFFKTPPQW